MSLKIKGSSKRRRRNGRGGRLIPGIVITIIILLILMLIAGMAYVWYSGQQEPIAPEPFPETTKRQTQVVEKPKITEGPVGVSSQVFTSSVVQGDNASLAIRTRPEAACSITLVYKDNQKSKDAGLLPKTADEFGTVQWTWTVEASRPVGKWPVEITCASGEMSGYLKLDLEVTPKG